MGRGHRRPAWRLKHETVHQARYLIVYAVWAWIVVLVFPLVFNFA
jgi:hypothetical protein